MFGSSEPSLKRRSILPLNVAVLVTRSYTCETDRPSGTVILWTTVLPNISLSIMASGVAPGVSLYSPALRNLSPLLMLTAIVNSVGRCIIPAESSVSAIACTPRPGVKTIVSWVVKGPGFCNQALKNQAAKVNAINPAEKIIINRTANLAIWVPFHKGSTDAVVWAIYCCLWSWITKLAFVPPNPKLFDNATEIEVFRGFRGTRSRLFSIEGFLRFNVGGAIPFLMASVVKIASTAPAAPNRCPIEDLVEDISKF